MINDSVDRLSRGEALGRYIVIERIGVGANGVVFAAYDPELDRKVALKILRRPEDNSVESRRQERFVREAKAIARLAHPNVVGIFDVGVDDGRVFLAMEYLAGGTLRDWMAAKKRPWREVVKMFVEVGRGLAAAHAEGLVHRDFKPDNVLLDRAGVPKVADFGLARHSGTVRPSDNPSSDAASSDAASSDALPEEETPRPDAPLTRSGTLAGTPAYMAPEQFRGKRIDERTDQFAFCIALYEALYGQRPFAEGTVFDLAESVMRERIQPAPKTASVPSWIRRSLVRGLRADPAQRYAQVEDLLSALQSDPVARMRRIVAVSLASLAIVATIVGLYRRAERRRVDFENRVASKLREGTQALQNAVVLKGRLAEFRSRSFASFDGGRRDEGEATWAAARGEAAKLEATLKRAQAALEAALALDQSNDEARDSLGEAVYERALLAEMEVRRSDLARHLEQLERVDSSKRLMARWTSPGAVEIRTTPEGARLSLERYELGGDALAGRLRPIAVGEPFVSPAAGRSLAPGSYRLTITRPGFVTTRYPFVVHRGEDLRFAIPLLAEGEVPAGFVYVPEGRFLFGDADEDWRLGFLNAGPQHERTTSSFFMKVHETTYGEWLEFLRDLPAAERRELTPAATPFQGSAIVKGSMETGWTLDLNISGIRLSAREKSPIVYPTRRTRAAQDWLKMPVVGISARDMQAYLDWLSRTGRIRGARFCTEAEWERAARGADDRSYPSTQARLTGEEANIDMTYGRVRGSIGPDEVGTHPDSASPFGIEDMAGNAWEVVRAPDETTGFGMRGGSFYQAHPSSRSTNREPIDGETRNFLIGLRVCAAKN